MEQENKKENEQMDIFTKGFVKQKEEVEKIEIEEDKNNKEIENNIKYNNLKMKEKANDLIKELEEQDNIREKKQKKKKKKKNILLIIGIIIEIIIIAFLCYIKFFKETYKTTLTCTNTVTDSSNKYMITTNNVYYFDKNDNVAKTENSIIYIFNDKTSYDNYKEKYVDTNIKNYKGINQIDQLKKNKNVKFKDNLITANIEGRKEPITIYIESYDSVLKTNEEIGFTCE